MTNINKYEWNDRKFGGISKNSFLCSSPVYPKIPFPNFSHFIFQKKKLKNDACICVRFAESMKKYISFGDVIMGFVFLVSSFLALFRKISRSCIKRGKIFTYVLLNWSMNESGFGGWCYTSRLTFNIQNEPPSNQPCHKRKRSSRRLHTHKKYYFQ